MLVQCVKSFKSEQVFLTLELTGSIFAHHDDESE